MGGNWDYEQLLDHYDMYHNVYLCNKVTYEEWKEAEERHRVSPIIFTENDYPLDNEKDPISKWNSSDSYYGRSSSNNVKSSGNSSDSSNSGNSSERKRVRKSASQRFAKASEEKIKNIKEEFINEFSQFKSQTS